MSFQENKFPIVLGAVTAVAAGGLIWWGMQSSAAYDTAKSEYDEKVSEIGSLMRSKVAPTPDNLREKKKAVSDYRGSVESLQKAFDKYRKPKLENTEVNAFSDALLAARKRVGLKFEEAGVSLPAGFFLGLGRYTDKLPQKKNTGLLHFELGAYEELFGRLAEAGPTELLNVHWPDLPEEVGRKYDFAGKSYRSHPIEITFQGSEESLRKFLSSLDDSEEYYYVVRTMRVSNSRSSAPNSKDASFEQAKVEEGPADPFGAGGFVFPDEEEDAPAEEEAPAEEAPEEPAPAAPAASDSGQILKQVLGSEEIKVFLHIDVLQFVDPKPLPKG